MKIRKSLRISQSAWKGPEQGVALVLTLLIVAMFTVLVVGFNAATRTEQMAARNFSKLAAGRTMASTAQQQAAALLASILTNTNRGLATQPGRALIWDSSWGLSERSLSSAAVQGASSEFVNLNAGGLIARAGASETNYFTVPWVYVSNNINGSNVIVGRYAFWIDDDGSRLNLNYSDASTRGSGAFYPVNPRPFDALMLDFPSAQTRTAFAANFNRALTLRGGGNPTGPTWGHFFHPRQLRMFTNPPAPTLWNHLNYQISAGPGNLTNTNLAPPLLGRQALFAGFLGQPASETAMDNFISNYVNSESLSYRFGGRTFGSKYTLNALRQIIANINDFTSGSIGTAFGANLLDPDEGVPRSFAALRPTPHLNEVAVRPYYAINANGSQLEVQVYLGVELVNPYPAPLGNQSRLYFDLERFDFTGTYERDGLTNNFSGGVSPWPRGGIFQATPITLTNDVPGRSYMADRFFYRWEWSVNTPSTNPASVISNVNIALNFQLRTVQLSQTTNPISMRDWACSTDLPVWTFNVGSTETNNFLGFGNTGPLQELTNVTVSDALARGVAKNDPRVRTFPAWEGVPNVSAWLPVGGGGPSITMGSNNSVVNFQAGTGTPRNLPNDDATNNIALQHPSFLGADRSQPGSWLSAFELGQIHTGLQWRTLQLHSQSTNEAVLGVIPDWALLDVFAVTNAYVPATSRLNPNSLPFPAMTNAGGLTTNIAVTNGMSRRGSYAALLSGFTSANNPGSAELFLIGYGMTNAGLLTSLGFDMPAATNAARNLAILDFNTEWSQRRAVLPSFPAHAYGSLAEILEVRGVGDRGATKAEKEQNARVVYESLSPFSDTFTVFAVGEGVEVISYPSGNVTNLIGRRAIMSQLRFDPVSGAVRPVSTWPVEMP